MNTLDLGSLDRARQPPAGAARGFRFPAFERTVLSNDLTVLVAPLDHVPLVELQMVMPAGGQYAPSERPGLPSFHAQLLDEGTESMSALEIARRMEELGGAIGSGADWNVAAVAASVLAEHLDEAFGMLADVIRRPSFPEAEVERLRRQRQTEILRQLDQPKALANRAFLQALYRGTPYQTPLIGTAKSLETIDRAALMSFYRAHATPAGMTLIAVGALDPRRLAKLAEDAFASWAAAEPPRPPVIEPAPARGLSVVLVDRPGAAQTHLVAGHVGVARTAPGYPERMLVNAILGGTFTSRLNLNLRERHGFTYGVRSTFLRRQGPGPFMIEAGVANDVVGRSVAEIVDEIERIREAPVGERELAETRGFLIDVFPYTIQTLDGVAQRLEDLVVYDLGDDYYEHFHASFAEVTAEQILAAARRHLHPDRLTIVAVGPADDLRPQLERFGPVTVTRGDDEPVTGWGRRGG